MYEEYFAQQLRKLRESRGLTLQELADILHTSKQVLSRYETGQRTPKISVAHEFATILGVPLSYFMPNPPRWEAVVWEDFVNAVNDQERLNIIEYYGLDPRAYDFYLGKQKNPSSASRDLRLTPHERQVLLAYRSHPTAQPFVDKLLELEPEVEAEPKQA